ncbi:MAG TPA: hypothetical protein VHV75_00900 [Solirubrobacteraceae bacterium]|nr:hypothetical protein [Solirubrobacteraceae bacterium]
MFGCVLRGPAAALRDALPVRFATSVVACVGLSLLALLSVSVAQAATPGTNCQPYSSKPCMFPFPDNRLTKPDKSSLTGLRLNLPQAAMPENTNEVRIGVGPYDQDDGFSPGSAILLHISQLDTQPALNKTHAVGLLNMSAYKAKNAPIVVIDETTGQRQMIYAQLDANANSAATRDLMIMPGSNWQDGHTYVVVLRNLRNAGGHLIGAPAWFEKLRDSKPLPAAERSQAKRYAKIFKALKRAKVSLNSSVYEAWNFTVASTKSLTGRLLSIRNQAFSQLGDTNLADGQVQGSAPSFQVSNEAPVTGAPGKAVIGTFRVPCYLQVCGDDATAAFDYSSSGLYPTPAQAPGDIGTADFECYIPPSATPSNPARISLYGHGLLGDMSEVTDAPITALADGSNIVLCATNWWGLAAPDQSFDSQAILNLNQFPVMIDRLQQGVLNALLLGRLMDNPQGLASNPSFQQNGQGFLNTSELYYDGNSQGGIFGGITTAVSPDIRRAVLGVTGEDYANSLVQRSTDFGAPDQGGTFSWLLWGTYANNNSALYSETLDIMDQLWDQADPVSYVEGLGAHPFADTPSHSVLMQIAYGDHQVSMYSAAAEARSIDASAYEPGGIPASALTPGGGRNANDNLFYGLKPVPLNGSYTGSAIEVWDSGPGHTQNPPVGNLAPPINDPANQDPHGDPRATPLAQQQISDFLQPNGTFVNVCGGQPCHSSDYTP